MSVVGCYAVLQYVSASGAFVEDELSKWCSCGRGAIAVSAVGCYAVLQYISASGAIVEDEQLQCKQAFSIPISWECDSTGVHRKPLSLLTSLSPPYLPIMIVQLSVICASYMYLVELHYHPSLQGPLFKPNE